MFKYIRNVLVLWSIALVVLVVKALAQPGEPVIIPSAVEFNWYFAIPTLLGWFPHWLIKWAANRATTPSLGSYLLDNIAATVTGFLGAFAIIFAMFQTNPAAFASFNPGSFLMVLMAAWGADTVNSNFSSKPPTPPPTQ